MELAILALTLTLGVLLLVRFRGLRGALAAAAISSAAAGLWVLLLSLVIPALVPPKTPMGWASAPLVTGAEGAVATFGLTIIPNFILLVVVRRLLWAGRATGASLRTTLARWAFVIIVGIVYGQLVQLVTLLLVILAAPFVLFLGALIVAPLVYPPNFLPAVPLLTYGASAVGGITAIGVQAAFNRHASVAGAQGAEKQ